MAKISFEEIMYTVIGATQDTFKAYMDIEVFAGKVAKEVAPVEADVVGIVGIGGERVGYIIFAVDDRTSLRIAQFFSGLDEPDPDTMRDAVGEMANNIAGQLKSKYPQFGGIALGLPLIMSGRITPIGGGSAEAGEGDSGSMELKGNGVIIPFKSFDSEINFQVMVFM